MPTSRRQKPCLLRISLHPTRTTQLNLSFIPGAHHHFSATSRTRCGISGAIVIRVILRYPLKDPASSLTVVPHPRMTFTVFFLTKITLRNRSWFIALDELLCSCYGFGRERLIYRNSHWPNYTSGPMAASILSLPQVARNHLASHANHWGIHFQHEHGESDPK